MQQPSASVALFACTLCNSRHPFEELSQGQQLCKDCRGAFQIVKCTYCRTEFQQESKSNLNTICKKCEQNVKLYGKPSACEYCNIIAAFIGNKCQRCTNSEKKYGPPLPCEQCKQRCAFDRKDPESRKKVDGKLLCWLCTLSYKRALAKAKQNDTSMRHTSISVHKSNRSSSRQKYAHCFYVIPIINVTKNRGEHRSHHRHHNSSSSNLVSNSSVPASVPKKPRLEIGKSSNGSLVLPTTTAATAVTDTGLIDPSNSDHVVAVTQLKEKMANLQKQLQKKDQELLEKDKKIAELKSQMKREEREWREKLQATQKSHNEKYSQLQEKYTQLQKQVASLSKANKKNASNANAVNNTTPNDSPLL
ncbi:Protein FAM76A-like protein [Dinothrombium tinctorium]|uniref:Protein FAM76A-like protein n=1 Tax=Dinothrombium tinctorium TaxID=1965070 RepID=A0A3S3RQJ8_9ACAR|nr:Protein FAM76A-like protein [Dinothrombium tinctorium]RWS04568.1 Protein FAM76A-like protein [Dinothrombium tinctorium]RWS04762.1 Protein FAM76A-like protein [Dinothrombium tinctorium]